MNSIEQKRKDTIKEVQFDKTLQETKNQIEQINKGIDVKKHLGENSYNHYTCDKANVESDRLAQRLGYVNPLEYEFVYLEPPKEN